jgi:hypothetical protein
MAVTAGAGARLGDLPWLSVRQVGLSGACAIGTTPESGNACTRWLLDELRVAGKLDLSRAVVDSSQIRALKGGPNRP